MKRLLCVVGGMDVGGAETFLMKLYRNLDKEKYQMDFCVSKQKKGFYDDEIISMGGKIFHITAKSKNPFVSFKMLYSIVKYNKYNYVMRISQHSLSALELVAAKFGGAQVRIFRSSNSNTMKGGLSKILHNIFKFLPNIVANVKIAPSILAAEFMFGKRSVQKGEVLFLNNGIPLSKFSYNKEQRDKIRREIGLLDQLLIGHIGRFSSQKNHKKLLEIFSKVIQEGVDAHLILVGEGELKNEIETSIKDLGFYNRVHFMGIRKDIPALLSSMDVFVFPSFYEGMPNTVIEAQANGVPCVISDTITSEAQVNDNVFMLPLDTTEEWTKSILRDAHRNESNINQNILKNKGYDIEKVCAKFVETVFIK